VCTEHCTVQCPVHRLPHAKIHFSCALSGGSPDSYCALSGVHRTGTVDCPVRPYSVFKKSLSARARGLAQFLPLHPLLSVSRRLPLLLAIFRRSPATGGHCPRLSSGALIPLSFPLSVSLPLFSLPLCALSEAVRLPFSTLCKFFKFL
jgi:hypothetical protein